jgi:hypothetical protein
MFTLEGPHIVMSRTDAQNGLDLVYNELRFCVEPILLHVHKSFKAFAHLKYFNSRVE